MPKMHTPPDIPEGFVSRIFAIPNSQAWLSLFSEALSQTIYPHNYEQMDETHLTPLEAAEAAFSVYEAWLNAGEATTGECPVPTIPGTDYLFTRKNPETGRFEVFDGEEWGEPTGENAIPEPEARTEATQDERTCSAAANAVAVLKQLYLAMVDFAETEIDPLLTAGEWALLIAGEISAPLSVGSAGLVAYSQLTWSLFSEALQTVTADYWTDEWSSKLTCILRDHVSESGGVVTFDTLGIRYDLQGFIVPILDEFLAVRWQTAYMLEFLGEQGLNLAGAKDITSGDCTECNEWCHTFDFSTGPLGWVAIRETPNYHSAPGVHDGTKWVNTLGVDTSGAYGHCIMLGLQFALSEITGVSIVYDRTNGQFTSQIYAERWLTNNWDSGVALGTKTQIKANLSPGTAGTNLPLSVTGDWANVRSLTLTCFASNRAFAVPSPVGSCAIKSITITGKGTNPFGFSNC